MKTSEIISVMTAFLVSIAQNPTTTIQFSVTHPGRVSLRIDDLLGRELATLVDERKEPGVYSVRWDAGSLPSGMYFYRVETNGRSLVRKMALVR